MKAAVSISVDLFVESVPSGFLYLQKKSFKRGVVQWAYTCFKKPD